MLFSFVFSVFRFTKIIHFLTSLVTTILSIQRPVKSDISIRYGTAVRQLLIMLPELSKYSDKVICGADHTAGKNWRQEVPGLTRMARGQDSTNEEFSNIFSYEGGGEMRLPLFHLPIASNYGKGCIPRNSFLYCLNSFKNLNLAPTLKSDS